MRFSTLFCLCVGIVMFVACVPGYGEILLFSCQTSVDIPPRELDGTGIQEIEQQIKTSGTNETLRTLANNLEMIAEFGVAYSFPSKVYVDYDSESGSIRRYQVEFMPIVLDTLNPEFSTINPKVICEDLETIVCNRDTQKKHRQWINPEKSTLESQELDYSEYTEAEWAFSALEIFNQVNNTTPLEKTLVGTTSKSKHVLKDYLVEMNVEDKDIDMLFKKSFNDAQMLSFSQFDQFKLPKLVTKKDAVSNITSILQLERVLEPDELPENLFATMSLTR